MQYLKADTAITLRIGPFVDNIDGDTPETGLTISQADIRLSKVGGDFTQTNDASGATHDELGWYYLQLDATDTNTEGMLMVMVHESGALPVWHEFMVVNANVFDSLFAEATTDYLQVDSLQIEGTGAANKINAEVLDVLNTDTFAEPGQEAPTSTTSLVNKIGYLYKFMRNKILTTSSEIDIYNDAEDTVDQKSTISDDGTTFTRGEFGTGP